MGVVDCNSISCSAFCGCSGDLHSAVYMGCQQDSPFCASIFVLTVASSMRFCILVERNELALGNQEPCLYEGVGMCQLVLFRLLHFCIVGYEGMYPFVFYLINQATIKTTS